MQYSMSRYVFRAWLSGLGIEFTVPLCRLPSLAHHPASQVVGVAGLPAADEAGS